MITTTRAGAARTCRARSSSRSCLRQQRGGGGSSCVCVLLGVWAAGSCRPQAAPQAGQDDTPPVRGGAGAVCLGWSCSRWAMAVAASNAAREVVVKVALVRAAAGCSSSVEHLVVLPVQSVATAEREWRGAEAGEAVKSDSRRARRLCVASAATACGAAQVSKLARKCRGHHHRQIHIHTDDGVCSTSRARHKQGPPCGRGTAERQMRPRVLEAACWTWGSADTRAEWMFDTVEMRAGGMDGSGEPWQG